MPFRIALSGLNAANTDLEVTGNNIANAATNGFKESRAEFANLYANATQDVVSVGAGQGVRVAQVAQQFSQGAVDFTSNNLDLAISGSGYFVLESPEGALSYTRAGAYSVDRDGYVINQAKDHLQVYEAVTGVDGATTFNTGVRRNLNLPTTTSAPTATTEIMAGLNLDASVDVPTIAFDPNDHSTYNKSVSTTIYDSLGADHTATLYFRRTGAGAWDSYMYVDGSQVTNGGGSSTFAMGFNSTGGLATPALGEVTFDAFDPGGGAALMDLTIDLNAMTQYGSNFEVNNLTQNGYTTGRLAGVDIDADGIVFARYTNGNSSALGKIALARFNNDQGLRQIGDTKWVESFQSGDAQYGEAGTSSFGQIQSGALESSNVDIAEQLVNLIIAQRNFQANAEVISTADTITQSIINIR